MEDPRLIVPYHDPYYENEELVNMMIDYSNPNVFDFPYVVEPSRMVPSSTTFNANMFEDNNADPYSEPIWGNLHDQNTNYGVSSSSYGDADVSGENLGIGNDDVIMPITIWPPQPEDSIWCSNCLVLREIIHTNGYQTSKLDIHGTIGMICHAILETEEDVFRSSSAKTREMIDLSMKSIENVKEILIQYCQERKQAGFLMMPDDLSTFYDTLYAVGLHSDDWTIDNDLLEPFVNNLEETDQINHQLQTESDPNQNYQSGNESFLNRNTYNRRRTRRPSLSEQRQRIASMSLNDITALFHLPIDEAAKRMDLCSTVVKKICRRDGLGRWPHRKVKSLQNKIEKLRPMLNSIIPEDRVDAQEQIQKFEQQLQDIFNGVSISRRVRQQ
ncbi:hypothetical protein ACFE04_012702 [Oxalis oulophora]